MLYNILKHSKAIMSVESVSDMVVQGKLVVSEGSELSSMVEDDSKKDDPKYGLTPVERNCVMTALECLKEEDPENYSVIMQSLESAEKNIKNLMNHYGPKIGEELEAIRGIEGVHSDELIKVIDTATGIMDFKIL